MAASKPSASASSASRPMAASPLAKALVSSSISLRRLPPPQLLQWFFTQCWHGAPVAEATH
eukprot:5521292-Heterocapsa_arctica.AAC.1